MKTAMRSMVSALALLVVAGFSAAAFAQADDTEGYRDGYQDGNYGRVRDARNGATIVRAGAEGNDAEQAAVNTPIFPGDSVQTDGNQRVEIQLSGGTLVRVDRDSEVVFQSLPDPGASYQDNAVLVLKGGNLRVVSRLADKEEFRVDSDASSVYLLEEADVRIEIDDRGRTRVASRRGVAEVVGADGSVLVRGGTQTAVDPGAVPEDPIAFRAVADDGFDRWCDARDDTYRAPDRLTQDRGRRDDADREEIPDEVRPYYGELSVYGTWADVPDYGRVWYPSNVGDDWRPYADGRWCYGPGGYFWVGSEPWGWAPYHYGCWQHVARYGWCWVPGRVFAGAWVSWSWGSAFVGWAPLDFWGRPCWLGGPRYHGFYDPGSWTFIGTSNIAVTNVRRYAVPITRVGGELDRAAIVARAPRVAPRDLARSAEWRDRAVREATQDRISRGRLTTADRVPVRKFTDVQERLAHRAPRQGQGQVGAPRFGADGRGPVARPSPRNQDNPGARGSGPRAQDPSSSHPAPFPRRIVVDPRAPAHRPDPRGDARGNVRDFYDRMSRPRETRESDPGRVAPQTPPRSRGPVADPRQQSPSRDRQATPSPRQDFGSPRREAPPAREAPPQRPAPRYDTPRERPAPRYDAPRERPSPRYEAPPQRPAPRYEAPPQRPAPRYEAPPQRSAPRYEAPPQRQAPPRAAPQPAPRPQQAPRPQAQPKQEKHGRRG